MADPIAYVANVQLGYVQAPEIAREVVPIAAQVQIANEQAAAIIARYAEEAVETVQQLVPLETAGVPDTLAGSPNHERPSYREARRRVREPVQSRAVPLAAAHPRGLGATVDVSA